MKRTARTSSSRRRAAPLLLLSLAAGACRPAAPPPPSPTDLHAEIEAALLASADAWTRGDLDGYLEPYAPDATFVGGTGLVRGRDEIRRRYVEGYWQDGAPEDALRFRLLDIRAASPGAAIAVGRYELYDRASGRTTASGVFSLTLERRAGAWRIVHDHSSADPG